MRRELTNSRARATHLEQSLTAAREAATQALDEHLAVLMYELDLQESERVSLYWIEVDRDRFKRSARYTRNPTLRTGGQPYLPLAGGIIGAALEPGNNGEYRATLSPTTRIARHREHATKGRLTNTSRIARMRMPSVDYHAFALIDPRTSSYGAVLIFESTRSHAWKSRNLRTMVHNRQDSLMRAVVAVESANQTSNSQPAAATAPGPSA